MSTVFLAGTGQFIVSCCKEYLPLVCQRDFPQVIKERQRIQVVDVRDRIIHKNDWRC